MLAGAVAREPAANRQGVFAGMAVVVVAVAIWSARFAGRRHGRLVLVLLSVPYTAAPRARLRRCRRSRIAETFGSGRWSSGSAR
jgi:hypothetical protein